MYYYAETIEYKSTLFQHKLMTIMQIVVSSQCTYTLTVIFLLSPLIIPWLRARNEPCACLGQNLDHDVSLRLPR